MTLGSPHNAAMHFTKHNPVNQRQAALPQKFQALLDTVSIARGFS